MVLYCPKTELIGLQQSNYDQSSKWEPRPSRNTISSVKTEEFIAGFGAGFLLLNFAWKETAIQNLSSEFFLCKKTL